MSETFASIAHRIIVVEKKRPVRELAEALGLESATLYSRLAGRAPFRPGEITALLRELPDPRLVDALLAGTPFIAIERLPETGFGSGKEATEAAVISAHETLSALLDLLGAQRNGRIGSADRSHIETHIREAERAMTRLRLALPHIAASAA